MAEKKRVTTAPLTPEEIEAAIHEIPEDEFLERFDEIFTRDLDLPETLDEFISLDDYMENELREMFHSIIAQYLRPIEYAIARIRSGDHSKRVADEGLEALTPIVNASETLEYDDITEILKQIEKPLRDLTKGGRRKLLKREVTELAAAWEKLIGVLRPEGDRGGEPEPQLAISLGSLPRFLDGVTTNHIRSLRNAGLTTLRDIAHAPVGDLIDVTGLPEAIAERIQSFARGAVATAGAGGRRSASGIPSGWMRVQFDSDIFKGRIVFEYATLGRYLEPVLARLAEAEDASKALPKKATRSRKPK